MSLIIKSNNIYCEDSVISGYLEIENGKFKEIHQSYIPRDEDDIIDYSNHTIIPGIIDLHSHGYATWAAKTINPNELNGLSNVLPSIGVTSTLATTTAWAAHEFDNLKVMDKAIEDGCEGTRILGIHMEGPFFNPDYHNATPRKEVQKPSLEKMKQYLATTKHIKYITIAPDIEGSSEIIAYLDANNIIVGGGHTNATYQQMNMGIDSGLKVSIHTGNAMRGIDRREVGSLGASLLNPNLYCEIICDLYHLSKEMIEIMFRIKNDMSKFLMISDSDSLAGVEPGDYKFNDQIIHVHKDGRLLLDDGTIFGSSKNVLYGIKNLVTQLHMPLEKVVPLFSLNPATLMNMQDEIGSIKKGKTADFVVLNSNFEVQSTYINGVCKYIHGDKLETNPRFYDSFIKLK